MTSQPHKQLIFIIMMSGLILCQGFIGIACTSNHDEEAVAPDASETTPGDVTGDISDDAHDTEEVEQVAQIILSPDPVEAVVSQSIQMTYRAYDAQGIQLDDQPVMWRVEEPTIATIDSSGLLRAQAQGQTQLIATSGDAVASVAVQVHSLDTIARIEISPQQSEVGVGDSHTFEIIGYRSDQSEILNLNLPIEWTSSAAEIAAIDEAGTLTGIKPGEVMIRARFRELESQATVRVELKFKDLVCLNHCLALSTQDKLYEIILNEVPIQPGLALPIFEQKAVENDLRFKSIFMQSTSQGRFCAISTQDDIYCWGQTIDNSSNNDIIEIPQALDTDLKFKTLDFGTDFICGLTLDDALYCWGYILNGTLSGLQTLESGSVYNPSEYSPPILMAEGPFQDLMLNGPVICVQRQKSFTWHCMGQGEYGGLGNGQRTNKNELTAVAEPRSFSAMATTPNHIGGAALCAVDADQQVWCWGKSIYGEFGQPLSPDAPRIRDAPERTAWDMKVTQISALGDGFCAGTLDHEIRCWGNNRGCALGLQSPGRGIDAEPYYQPQAPVSGIPSDWKSITDKCILTEGGDIWCWGLQRRTSDPVTPTRCEPQAQRLHTF